MLSFFFSFFFFSLYSVVNVLGIVGVALLGVYILVFFSLVWVSDFWLGLDLVSMLMVGLSYWLLVALMIVVYKYGQTGFFMKSMTIVLVFFLFFSFFSLDLLGFYVFFELGLLPLIVMVVGWGYQVERIQASFYLFIYTMVGSMPLLLVFLLMVQWSLLWFLFCFSGPGTLSGIISLIMVSSLFIKFPVYIYHLWLPKAHVEAPVGGSMALAAVVLKMSSYGLYRVSNIVSFTLLIFFLVLVVVGAFFSSVICLSCSDIKSLVAYSSVSHMGVVGLGLLVFSVVGINGSFIVMLGHGFCSSMLFYLVGFHYERNMSRQLLINRGQSNLFFYILIFWFVFLAVNFGAPPFLNMWGEISIFFSVGHMWFLMVVLGVVSFLVAAYCLYLYSSVLHGHSFKFMSFLGSVDIIFLLGLWHFTPLLFCMWVMGGF